MWTQQKQLADEMLSSRASPAITNKAVVGLQQKKRVWERAKERRMFYFLKMTLSIFSKLIKL